MCLPISFGIATTDDVEGIFALRSAVAQDLTARYGRGQWSSIGSERGVRRGITSSKVCVARLDDAIVAMVRLSTIKPWAIDTSYFPPCARPLYLTDMAVHPSAQNRGIGRACIAESRRIGTEWPADVIRLDAYAGEVGAGAFYARCGFAEVGRATFRNTPLIYYQTEL
ncbi:MAG TPA: GNAT family N-acetyltransferase [Gemmatimonadaceae bacterium]|nr:GNAT family N-acetyltransferase [Gemmatimonadaceae bacterium]